MHRLRLGSLLLACAVASGCTDRAAAPTPLHAPGGAAPGASAAAEGGGYTYLFAGRSVPADFARRVAAAGGEVDRTIPAIGVASVRGLDAAAAAALGAGAEVALWSEELLVTLDEPAGELALEPASLPVEPTSAADPTTANLFARQWNLRQIGMEHVWAAGRLGSPGVKVGILDSGLDYTHPDLAGRVDLSLSRAFIGSDDEVIAQLFPGAHPVADLRFHGTHAGAIVSSNALGSAGVTSGVTLVGLKVVDRNGLGSAVAALEAIVYAADVGLDVLNLSVGSGAPIPRRQFEVAIEAINRAMTYAHDRGTTVVVAAGNGNLDLAHQTNAYTVYCSSPTVICVAATGPAFQASPTGPWTDADARAPYSNYGLGVVDVAAPGGNRPADVYAACSRFSLLLPVCRTGAFSVATSGTSQAAPHVAGLAALLVERHGRRPGLIRQVIRQSADDLGKPGADAVYGSGRINAARALGL
ncbi:MAG TPA: S8 family serine peptidase [Longimicrobiaceae bacterium]|nr:S8 family serine peptidase [Longimicrobiaceae bacterium]